LIFGLPSGEDLPMHSRWGLHQVEAIEGEGEEEGNKEVEGKQEQEPLEPVRQSLKRLKVGKVQPGRSR